MPCKRCTQLEAELAEERARRCLGGVPPPVDPTWGNAELPRPEHTNGREPRKARKKAA